MQDFMKAEVTFSDMPADHRGWSQSTSASMSGGKVTKTTTRKVNMPDGSTKELVVTETLEL